MAAMTTCTVTTAATTANTDERGGQMSPQGPCDCDAEARTGQLLQATAGPVAVPKTSAVGSSLFTIDSILAPSRSSEACNATAVTATGRNNVTAAATAAAAAAAAAGFFKQPINFGHLAAAAAASGYANSTAANFLGKSLKDDNRILCTYPAQFVQFISVSLLQFRKIALNS